MTFAFIFPGQGSQSVGMQSDLAASYPTIKNTYQEASDALDYDLWSLIQEGPAEELNKTHITQPAMLVAGIAVWRVWQEQGGALPSVMAGHSLGEYTALVATECLSLADAVCLVADRGQFMQQAVPAGVGAMAAILGMDDEKVIDVCAEAAESDVLSAVNFNSPGQVVIAGNTAAVERAIVMAKAAGAKRALLLPVSVPSHCSLMLPAAEKLAQRMETIDFKTPTIPVYNNVDVMAETDAVKIRDALKRQLFSPVRWVDTINCFAQQDVQMLIECGPGKVLAGLTKRINREITAYTSESVDSFAKALQAPQGGDE